MILPVRPHFIFDQVKENRSVTVPIPERQLGSPSLLETYLLIAVGRIVKPTAIFEIGTFAGQTTQNLSINFPQADIYTLDLDLSRGAARLANCVNVTQLVGHSMAFNFAGHWETCGLVFIDGGHDYGTVESDTVNAMKIIAAGRYPSAIVWHDFDNPQFPDVSAYLKTLDMPIYHVLDTQIAVYFAG